jgi:hypothetical protein
MVAAIRNRSVRSTLKFVLLAAFVSGFTACATKEKPPLVSTGNEPESALPWNKQEKWENQGQLSGMAERMNSR